MDFVQSCRSVLVFVKISCREAHEGNFVFTNIPAFICVCLQIMSGHGQSARVLIEMALTNCRELNPIKCIESKSRQEGPAADSPHTHTHAEGFAADSFHTHTHMQEHMAADSPHTYQAFFSSITGGVWILLRSLCCLNVN